MNRNITITVFVAIIAILAMAAMAHIASVPPIAHASLHAATPVHLRPADGSLHAVIDFDTSLGDRRRLGQFTMVGAAVGGDLHRDVDSLACFRTDCRSVEFYDAPAGASADDLLPTFVRELRRPPERPGTMPASFWRTMKLPSTGRVVIVLFGDADDDAPTSATRSEMRSAAAALGRNKNVILVVFAGAEAENRSRIRSVFGKELGAQRLAILGPTEVTYERIESLVRSASK